MFNFKDLWADWHSWAIRVQYIKKYFCNTVNAWIVVQPFFNACTPFMYETHVWKKGGLLIKPLRYDNFFCYGDNSLVTCKAGLLRIHCLKF